MERIELLVALYRLALRPPAEGQHDLLLTWLSERQRLIDRLLAAPPDRDSAPIERALVSVIVACDRGSLDRLVSLRRRIGAMLGGRRPRGYA